MAEIIDNLLIGDAPGGKVNKVIERTQNEPKEKHVAASKMRRNEWIEFAWVNVTAYGDKEPMYLFLGVRPIEQRKEAAEQFDAGKEKT